MLLVPSVQHSCLIIKCLRCSPFLLFLFQGVLLHGLQQGRGGDAGGVHGLLHHQRQLHQQPPRPALDQSHPAQDRPTLA